MGNLTPDEQEKLTEIIETWDSLQTGIKVVQVIGNAIKWIVSVATAIGAFFFFYHDGHVK